MPDYAARQTSFQVERFTYIFWKFQFFQEVESKIARKPVPDKNKEATLEEQEQGKETKKGMKLIRLVDREKVVEST